MRGRTGRGRGFICDFKVIEGGLVWGVMAYPRIWVNGHGIGGKGGQRWEWEWGQSIPPSNHKNRTSAFMNVDISSISICLCRASPQEPPHLPPVTHPAYLLKPPPQTPTAYPSMYIRDITKNRIHTKATPRRAHAPWPNAKQTAYPKTPSTQGSDFPKPEKETTRKTKGKKASPPPFCVSPASQEEAGGKRMQNLTPLPNACCLSYRREREREREKGNLDPGASVGV